MEDFNYTFDKNNLNYANFEDREFAVKFYFKNCCLEKFLANIKRDYPENVKIFLSHTTWDDNDDIDNNLKRIAKYFISVWLEVILDKFNAPDDLNKFMQYEISSSNKWVLVWTPNLKTKIDKNLEENTIKSKQENITKEYKLYKLKIKENWEDWVLPILIKWKRKQSFPFEFLENFWHLLVHKFTNKDWEFDETQIFEKIPKLIKKILEIKDDNEKYLIDFNSYSKEVNNISNLKVSEIEFFFEKIIKNKNLLNIDSLINWIDLDFILENSEVRWTQEERYLSEIKYFSWRVKEILFLNNILFPNIWNKTWVTVINWKWGIWKSAIAKQFASINQDNHTFNFIINCSDKTQMKISYDELSKRLGISIYEKSLEDLILEVKEKLSKQNNYWWLLIFDNVIKQEDVSSCIPLFWWSVIITTQDTNWELWDYNIQNLDILTKWEWFELVSKILWTFGENIDENEKTDIQKLVKRLWKHPLALKNASFYIKNTGRSVKYYLSLLDRGFPSLMKLNIKLFDYEKTIYESLSISLENIQDPFLKEFFYFMSFLDETNLPLDFIKQISEIYPISITDEIEKELYFNDCLSYWYKYSIIEKNEKTDDPHIHRLQNEIINISIPWDSKYYIELLVKYMKSYCEYDTNNPNEKDTMKDMNSHIFKISSFIFDEFVTNGYKKVENIDKQIELDTIELLKRSSDYSRSIANNFSKSIDINTRLISYCKNMDQNSTVEQIENYYNLWKTFIEKWDYNKAKKEINNWIDISKELKNEIEEAKGYVFLIRCYEFLWNYNEWIKFFEKAKSLFDKNSIKDSLDVALMWNNAWNINYQIWHYDDYLLFHKKALKIRLSDSWDNNIIISDNYNSIWFAYYCLWNYKQSLKYHNKSLKIKVALFWEYHTITALSYNNIWVTYEYIWDYEKSLYYAKKVLKIRRKKLWENHILTALSYNNIWVSYQFQWNYEKALEYHNNSLEIRKNISTINTDIAMSYTNIWYVFIKQKKYKEAREQLSKSINVFEKNTIKDSIFLWDAYMYLWELDFEEQNYKDSEANIFEALEIYEKTSRKKELKECYILLIKIYKKTWEQEKVEEFEYKLENLETKN